MKKVITILAILVVLTSAVFAASETHTLRLSATVDTVLPQFQLVYGDYRTNNGQTIKAFADEADYDLTESAIDVSEVLILDKDGDQSIEFSVIIANKPKAGKGSSRSYTLTFGGGTFASVKKAGVAAPMAATIVTSNGAKYNDGVTVTGVGGSTAKVTLGSEPATAGNEIVKATYTYEGDRTVDPGTYTTDIILSIAQD
jgi:hypothetical protein